MPLLALLALAIAPRADWVPARWASNDPKSLDLVRDTPVNCLVLEAPQWSREFSDAAAKAGVATLGVVRSGSGVKTAEQAGLTGLVLEGDFVGSIASSLPVVRLGLRSNMAFEGPIIGTDQGLWPGMHPEENGATAAAASGSVWIDTNAGFLRYVHAVTGATMWIANTPPAGNIYPVERYLQAIGDAAMTGARWVVALDGDLTQRLLARDEKALKAWKRITRELAFYEEHKEWRSYQAFSKLALIESPETGALLSGGVLDMIATKHTPVRPARPGQQLDGNPMVVDITKGWKFPTLQPGQITLSKDDTAKLDAIWKELNPIAGRRNFGARLFNASTLQSNLTASKDGKQVVLHLVNYADYAVENVTVHLLGKYGKAILYKPDGAIVLDLYPTDEGVGFDLDQVGVIAAIVLTP